MPTSGLARRTSTQRVTRCRRPASCLLGGSASASPSRPSCKLWPPDTPQAGPIQPPIPAYAGNHRSTVFIHPKISVHPLARGVTRMAGGSAVYCAGPSVARSSRLFLQPSVKIHRCGRDCEVLDPTTVRVDSRPLAQTDEWHFVVQEFLDSANDARPLL